MRMKQKKTSNLSPVLAYAYSMWTDEFYEETYRNGCAALNQYIYM